jgi:hypothetical protein
VKDRVDSDQQTINLDMQQVPHIYTSSQDVPMLADVPATRATSVASGQAMNLVILRKSQEISSTK